MSRNRLKEASPPARVGSKADRRRASSTFKSNTISLMRLPYDPTWPACRRVPGRFLCCTRGRVSAFMGALLVFTSRPQARRWAEEHFPPGIYAIRNVRTNEQAAAAWLYREVF